MKISDKSNFIRNLIDVFDIESETHQLKPGDQVSVRSVYNAIHPTENASFTIELISSSFEYLDIHIFSKNIGFFIVSPHMPKTIPSTFKYEHASKEALEIIELNECVHADQHAATTARFKAVFNEVHRLRALIEWMVED